MLARTDSRYRAVVMLVLASLVAGLIGARLVWWQVIDRDRLADMGYAQLAHAQDIPATRGLILDRAGLILATSTATESVFATPPSIEDPAQAAPSSRAKACVSSSPSRVKANTLLPWWTATWQRMWAEAPKP